MQDVPKIVRDRLQATRSAVTHPDADLLTAFAEQSLTAAERADVFNHLASCGVCRDVIALALPHTEELLAVATPVRRGWLTWPVLRWGFVAAGVAIVASLGVLHHQRSSTLSLTDVPKARIVLKEATPQVVAAPPPVAASTQRGDTQTAGRIDSREVDSSGITLHKFDELSKATGAASEPKPAAPTARPFPGATRSAFGATVGGPLPPSQYQSNNNAQQQVSSYAAPPALNRPRDQISSDKQAAAASGTTAVDGAAPVTDGLGARPQAQPRDQSADSQLFAEKEEEEKSGVSKSKLPVAPVAAGQIAGYVVDPSGAVVANARITVTPAATGKSATAVTDSRGEFLIAGLPTGNYKAQAQAPGFNTTVLDLNYDASRPSSYSFTLNPGSVSETVEVSSAQSTLQTDSAASRAITNRMVNKLQVSGRNLATLPRWTVSASGTLQRSFDQGKSWQTVNVNALSMSSASMEIVATESRAKDVSKKKGADKKLSQEGGVSPVFRTVTAAGSEVWAGGSAGALYHSLDSGANWTRVVPASAGIVLTGDIVSLEFSDALNGRVTTSTAEIWSTSDSGQTWKRQ